MSSSSSDYAQYNNYQSSSNSECSECDDEYIQETNRPTKVYCSLCDVYLSKNYRNITTHNLGNIHRKCKVEDYMKRNAITYVNDDEDKLWCKICKTFFDYYQYDDLFNHVDDAGHASLFEEIDGLIDGEDISIDDYCKTFAQDKAYCGLCEAWVPCSGYHLEIHIKGHNHSHLKAEDYMKRNAIFHYENDNDTLWCKICNIDIEYIAYSDLYDHINDDEKHCSLFEAITELIDGEDVNIDGYCENVGQIKAYCSRCDVWIQCHYNCLKQHVYGLRHTS